MVGGGGEGEKRRKGGEIECYSCAESRPYVVEDEWIQSQVPIARRCATEPQATMNLVAFANTTLSPPPPFYDDDDETVAR